MNQELTPWHDGSVTCPDKPGVYQIRYGHNYSGYSHWSGKRWGLRCSGLRKAFYWRKGAAFGPVDSWRGLAREPKP